MASKAKIRFYLRGKKLMDGTHPITLQVSHKCKYGYVSLGRRCLPHQWDEKTQRLNSKFPNSHTYNAMLSVLEEKANNLLYYLSHTKKDFIVEEFLELWKSKSVKDIQMLTLRFAMDSFEFQNETPVLPSLTYIMVDGSVPGCVKIGRSIDPRKREKTLEAQKPDIKLLATTKNNIERELHNKFKNLRVRGEWFRLSEDQVKEVVSHYKFTVVATG